jgi:uncharacterized protein YdeI (YjbR/CyaY-like superfamily)
VITDPEVYFVDGCGRCARFATADCSTRRWAVGLADLRRICRETGMAETAKWGHPCYIHAGRNIAIIGAFRDDFRLSFFDAALLTDPHGLLEKQGPNTRHADMLRFTANEQVVAIESIIRAYMSEAIANAAAGLVAPKEAQDIELPDELIEALSADPALAEAFTKLTPGRQRSYAISLSSAKKADTRRERIVRFRDRIIAGKGATER